MPTKAIPWIKVVVHALLLAPLAVLLRDYQNGALANQADPVNYITHFTGDWALWILLISLAVTPVRRIHSSLAWLIRLRRLIGLYAFFYASLHLATYIFLFSGYDTAAAIDGLRQGKLGAPFHQFGLAWPSILDDIRKRPFIQVGFAAWVILLSLAVTSPQRVLRWMGGKNWQLLHRLVYLAGVAAVFHYWWLVKTGVTRPLPDTVVLAVLFLARIGFWAVKRLKMQRAAGVTAAGV
jgi:sulfoxide reductase heme-binding subunit YedZ